MKFNFTNNHHNNSIFVVMVLLLLVGVRTPMGVVDGERLN